MQENKYEGIEATIAVEQHAPKIFGEPELSYSIPYTQKPTLTRPAYIHFYKKNIYHQVYKLYPHPKPNYF